MRLSSAFLALILTFVLGAGLGSPARAHSPHLHEAEPHAAPGPARPAPEGLVSGQGAMRFKVRHTRDLLPARAQAVLEKAHGGFAVDRRPGRGEVYFALPGAGILVLSKDLGAALLLGTDEAMRDTNLHNTTLWQGEGGTPYLTFPANEVGQVFTTALTGDLVHTLLTPTGQAPMGSVAVSQYFEERGNFAPTDVEVFRKRLYVTTGYSNLDWVLTANVETQPSMSIRWHDLAFGGRGTGPGQLGTGHGITIVDGTRVEVADRPHSEIDRYSLDGEYLSTLNLPEGSYPCDIDYEGGYAVVGALHGPDREKGAPIYILKDDQVVSTVMPKEELGLERFQHIHNAVLKRVGDRFFIIAQSWNPGDFVILEQVPGAE